MEAEGDDFLDVAILSTVEASLRAYVAPHRRRPSFLIATLALAMHHAGNFVLGREDGRWDVADVQ